MVVSVSAMAIDHESLEKVQQILRSFEQRYLDFSLRERVLALVPAIDALREVGKSLVPTGLSLAARDRLLKYFRAYSGVVLNEKELSLVARISEWARRVRELRVQFGWAIISGITAKQMIEEGELQGRGAVYEAMGPNDYLLADPNPDREAAYRWNIANEIRRSGRSMWEKILEYFRRNVAKPVTGEELSYVAQGSEWARRVRELRTEEGWPIATRMSGNPLLAIGTYVLEMDRQAPRHDRRISESVRREAMRRDNYRCKECGWHHGLWNPSDPRFLELHHVVHHANGGDSSIENLTTYCNVCHDSVHSMDSKG